MVGEIKYNRKNEKMELIEYNSSYNIIVKFENGLTKKTTYQHFKNGEIRNPIRNNIFGVGTFGIGVYKGHENGSQTKAYGTWHKMLERCYSKRDNKDFNAYKDCSVCEEWHNFQNFAKWFYENYYEIENERMDLDKDIFGDNSRLYSPETCCFVPSKINSAITTHSVNKTTGIVGIRKEFNKYIVTTKYDKDYEYNRFNNIEDAIKFREQYKKDLIYKAIYKFEKIIPDRIITKIYEKFNLAVQI